ncbi:MAG: NADH:flavin oxidoreductase/NADH oxidase [Acholeplasmataceae bacterium]
MLFDSYKIKETTFKNRAVMAPMCMYSADEDGMAQPFHTLHYGTRAVGGVGLVIVEATAIDPDGRISLNDLGIWSDDHIKGLTDIAHVIRSNNAISGIQINHAGRKARVKRPIGPSAIALNLDQAPHEMTEADIKKTIEDFKQAARRADQAGFELLEIHAAHGYLIYQFLSPLSNKRTDRYKDGVLFLKEVIEAILEVWPKDKLLGIRISATEYHELGITVDDAAEIINQVKDLGIDMIHISSGGNALVSINLFPGYQLGLAKTMKEKTGLITIGGGLITDVKLSEFALQEHMCDFVFYGRILLRDPYFLLNHAKDIKHDIEWPKAYERGK